MVINDSGREGPLFIDLLFQREKEFLKLCVTDAMHFCIENRPYYAGRNEDYFLFLAGLSSLLNAVVVEEEV